MAPQRPGAAPARAARSGTCRGAEQDPHPPVESDPPRNPGGSGFSLPGNHDPADTTTFSTGQGLPDATSGEPSGATPHPRPVSRPHDPTTTARTPPVLVDHSVLRRFSAGRCAAHPTGHQFPETGPPRRRTPVTISFTSPKLTRKPLHRGPSRGHRT